MSKPWSRDAARARVMVVCVGGLAVAAGAWLSGQSGARDVRLTLSEGTSMAAAVSPDGRRLAIDLLGALWTLDAAGGPARRDGCRDRRVRSR